MGKSSLWLATCVVVAVVLAVSAHDKRTRPELDETTMRMLLSPPGSSAAKNRRFWAKDDEFGRGGDDFGKFASGAPVRPSGKHNGVARNPYYQRGYGNRPVYRPNNKIKLRRATKGTSFGRRFSFVDHREDRSEEGVNDFASGDVSGLNAGIDGKDKTDYLERKNSGDPKICFSKACVQAASDILNNMDKDVDPCEDFYQFTCGSFLKNTVIPDDKTSVSQFSKISDELKEKLRILVQEKPEKTEIAPFTNLKHLYQSCLNKTRISELGLTPLTEVLEQLGGWPAVVGDNWKDSDFSWTEIVYKFRKMGFSVDYFFDFSIVNDLKNSTWRIIDIDQPSLGMSRKYFMKGVKDPDIVAYHKYQTDLAVLLGAEPERAKKDMMDALLFEIAMSNYSLPDEERRNTTKLYNKMTVGDLATKWPSIPWLDYINRLLAPFHKIDASEPVIVDVPSYITEFEKLIAATPKRTIANYVMWRVAAASAGYLTENARDIQLEFSTKLTGRSEQQARWKECMGVVLGSYSNAIGSMYVRRYFDETAKDAALEMVQDIRVEFDKILDEIDWMDPKTKERAKEKSKRIVTHIAYPSELLEDQKLVELYDGLNMRPEHYYRNMLDLTVFGTDYSFKRLREIVNKTDWISHGKAAVVNAFYSPLENSIQFPAGILQGIFFNAERPKYLNYGAIGFVIGHEITHGFDDQGKQFDSDGNLVDWWEPDTASRFKDRAQCIIWQYGNYTVPEINLNVNGINTQGENIADNGGVKEAYRAFLRLEQRFGGEPALPGLQGYNSRQMFWIAAGNTWCGAYRPEALKLRLLTARHSPAQFRVNGPLANMPEFAQDFKCKPKAPMNPEQRCTVW